jgi:hypothetical protein
MAGSGTKPGILHEPEILVQIDTTSYHPKTLTSQLFQSYNPLFNRTLLEKHIDEIGGCTLRDLRACFVQR